MPQAVEDYTRWFLGRLRGVEAALADRDFLCAGRFTVADISVGYALMLTHFIDLDKSMPETVAAYWQRLSQRDGFKRAKAAQKRAAEQQGVPAYRGRRSAPTVTILGKPVSCFANKSKLVPWRTS